MYRVDIVFDGAVESQEEYETYDSAKYNYDLEIDELLFDSAGYDWTVELYDLSAEPPEVVYSHEHEAMTLYDVTFKVSVHADDPGHAEARAKQAVRDNPSELYAYDIFPDK